MTTAIPRRAFAVEPRRERPASPPPSYGVPRRGGSFVDWRHVLDRLQAAEGYWLGTVTPDARPHAVPVWGVLVQDDLFLETGDMGTVKNRNLVVNPEVAVHLDGVNDVVIVRGTARLVAPEPGLGEALSTAFGAKYPGYDPSPTDWSHGGLIVVEPRSVLAWGDMPTATRWRFTDDRLSR